MENEDLARGSATWRKPVRDPYIFGFECSSYMLRWLDYYFADLGPAGFATVLEEVASRLSNEAEILRSR